MRAHWKQRFPDLPVMMMTAYGDNFSEIADRAVASSSAEN
jgi:hypothetical protein